MSAHGEVIVGPLEALSWLSALVRSGPLVGCVVCRTSTVWSHPVHGGLHPRCVPRAMALFEADGGGESKRPVAQARRRGAYARRAATV